MATPFVKICGLSTVESVECAVHGDADAIGFVLTESVRQVSVAQARELASRVPEHIETVGVFRGQTADEAIELAQAAGLSTIQFHGHTPLASLRQAEAAGFTTLRAFGIDEWHALDEEARTEWQAQRLLIDAVEPGSGVTFDAALLAQRQPEGWWLLAGGLNPGNVGALITALQPSGVDVSSGVESSRGIKSLELISQFITNAKHASSP